MSADSFQDDFLVEDINSSDNEEEETLVIEEAADEIIPENVAVEWSVPEGSISNSSDDEKTKPVKKRKSDDVTGVKDVLVMSPEKEVKQAKRVKRARTPANVSAQLEELAHLLNLHDCNEFDRPRVDSNYCEFIRFLFPEKFKRLFSGKKTSGPTGSPRVIVLTSSAVRAVDLARVLRGMGDCKVAKLFAKHFKIEEQVGFLKLERCPLAVATPNRLLKLMGEEGKGALKLDSFNFLVIDGTFRDKKENSILDIPELKSDLLELFERLPEHTKVCSF